MASNCVPTAKIINKFSAPCGTLRSTSPYRERSESAPVDQAAVCSGPGLHRPLCGALSLHEFSRASARPGSCARFGAGNRTRRDSRLAPDPAAGGAELAGFGGSTGVCGVARAREEFLVGISHERLRPLRPSVRGPLGALVSPEPPPLPPS